MKKISVCIPTFNEANNIEKAVVEVENLFRKSLNTYQLEIIVTDNASQDGTWERIRELASQRTHLKAARFSRNFGYQNSIFAGLCLSTGDAVVELDADLEDPPEVIVEFVRVWEQGYQVAYGVRRSRHNGWLRKKMIGLYYFIFERLSDFQIPRDAGDFRLLDRKVVEVLKALPERNLYLRGLVSFAGFQQMGIPYDRNPRQSGASKFSLWSYLVLAFDAVTSFSKKPLRLISGMGIFVMILSLGLAAYYLIERLFYGTPIQGFATLAILILFFQSLIFLALGVIGEYLSRIFDDAKARPRVIIAEGLNLPQSPEFL